MDDVLNTTNNDEAFRGLKYFLKENFEIKTQTVPVLKYLNLWIYQPHHGFIIYKTGHIIELFFKWFTAGRFW